MIRPRVDIHKYAKRVENAKRVLNQCTQVSEHNKSLLLRYADFKRAQGLSLGRIAKLLYTLKNVASILGKDFTGAIKDGWRKKTGQIT